MSIKSTAVSLAKSSFNFISDGAKKLIGKSGASKVSQEEGLNPSPLDGAKWSKVDHPDLEAEVKQLEERTVEEKPEGKVKLNELKPSTGELKAADASEGKKMMEKLFIMESTQGVQTDTVEDKGLMDKFSAYLGYDTSAQVKDEISKESPPAEEPVATWSDTITSAASTVLSPVSGAIAYATGWGAEATQSEDTQKISADPLGTQAPAATWEDTFAPVTNYISSWFSGPAETQEPEIEQEISDIADQITEIETAQEESSVEVDTEVVPESTSPEERFDAAMTSTLKTEGKEDASPTSATTADTEVKEVKTDPLLGHRLEKATAGELMSKVPSLKEGLDDFMQRDKIELPAGLGTLEGFVNGKVPEIKNLINSYQGMSFSQVENILDTGQVFDDAANAIKAKGGGFRNKITNTGIDAAVFAFNKTSFPNEVKSQGYYMLAQVCIVNSDTENPSTEDLGRILGKMNKILSPDKQEDFKNDLYSFVAQNIANDHIFTVIPNSEGKTDRTEGFSDTEIESKKQDIRDALSSLDTATKKDICYDLSGQEPLIGRMTGSPDNPVDQTVRMLMDLEREFRA